MEHTTSDHNTLKIRSTWRFAVLALVLALLVVGAPRARAGAYTYSTRQRTINAGILLVDDAPGGTFVVPPAYQDPSPYVFYILNQRTDIEPFGWNIVNPMAPHQVTESILTRWAAQTTGLYPGSLTLGQTITPNMAPYWEVSLSQASLTDLEQFNVLLLNLDSANVSFTDQEVNELRRYVDNGGQLWIEGNGNASINSADPLFVGINFNTVTGSGAVLPSTGNLLLHAPVVGTPYLMTPSDLGGISASYSAVITGLSAGTPPDTGLLSSALVDPGAADQPVISAGQFGAGQIIVDSLGVATNINNSVSATGSNVAPFTNTVYANAPSADLQLVSDFLSWTAAHPNEYQTSHQSSQSPNTLGPALTPTWTYAIPTNTTATTPGAAVNGSFVYVRGADGILRCFNATPGTDIIGSVNPDAGIQDYSLGAPYDEVWDTGGAADGFAGIATQPFHDLYSSAPTVVQTPDGQSNVFIEASSGQVDDFNATTGAAGSYGGGVLGGGGGSSYTSASGPAPAPTYYDGRIYAGQPDGSLFVYDLRTATAFTDFPVDAANNPVIEPPTVGIVHENLRNGNAGYTDDLVVSVTTSAGTYTLQGGSFHDYLVPPTGAQTGGTETCTPLSVNQISVSAPFEIFPDTNTRDYDDTSAGYQYFLGNTLSPGNTGFSINSTYAQPYFGDYDVDFTNSPSTPDNSLIRDEFTTGNGNASYMSPPALDSNGNFYYTVNVAGAGGTDSSLVCAHDGRFGDAAPSGRLNATQMQWRFRLPYTSEGAIVDADGVDYGPLDGFQFVGAPVVDTLGDVYALATNGSSTAVLCFNATGEVYVHLPVNSTEGTVQVSTLEQPITGAANKDEFGNTLAPVFGAGTQFNGLVDENGNMQIQSFGANSPNTNPPTTTPNLSEPQPVDATYTMTVNGGSSSSTVQGTMHTNMTWYAIIQPNVLNFPAAIDATPSLTLVGNYLFFADTNGNIYRLYAYPQNDGMVQGGTREVALYKSSTTGGVTTYVSISNTQGPLVADVQTNIGSIDGVLSAGNGTLIANGQGGIAAFGSQSDLVADSTRVMEVDSEGVATWAVDSTAETNPTTGLTTHLALNRPRDITQVSSNDYLVADTGNNRCVRFDRAGNVLWELTNFNDVGINDTTMSAADVSVFSALGITKPQPILAPGEPLTLNHPTSVTSYVQNIVVSGVFKGTVVHYLIADTGNYRIIEVVDTYNAQGLPIGPQHNLIWVSHTYDGLGRKYAYTSANYFTGPNGANYIAALVQNERIGGPIVKSGTMLPISQDAPGSSIVLLDYNPSGGATPVAQDDGYISHTISTFEAFENASGNFELSDAPVETAAGTRVTPSGTPVVLYLRNPRFLQTYTPPGATSASSPVQDFLLADDNGVFDLFLNAQSQLEAQWGFTQVDYQDLLTYQYLEDPINPGNPENPNNFAPIYNSFGEPEVFPGTLPAVPVTRNGNPSIPNSGIPFLPNSIQRVTTDTVGYNGTNYLIGRYIVTNGYSTGSVTPTTGFGGEVLTLAVPPDQTTNLSTGLVSAFGDLGNAAPLSQPTYAGQEK